MDSAIRTEVLVRNADSYAVWVYAERGANGISQKELLSMLNAQIQIICNDHISTLDDRLVRSNPRPNPVPRIFVEQGNELSRVLWLRWES
jgi:hypothetical protein